MVNDGCCEALSFASNYLASVRLDDVPRFRNGYLPHFSTNDGTAASAIVEARILLSTAPANITVNVPRACRIRAPYVQCHEKWFRRDVSWHAFSDGGLCYIHWEEWRDSLDIIERECGEGALLPMGAALCAELSVQLMERHLTGYRQKRKTWPRIWSSWAHGEKGTEEYRAAKKRRLAELAVGYRMRSQAIPK
jgi:hypothetical protein